MKTLINIVAFLGMVNCAWSQVLQPEQVVRVPAIFHIIYSDRAHSGYQGANTSENISEDLILAELKNLSQDFMLANADTTEVLGVFKGIIGNPRIEFYLADTLLQAGGRKGILRLKTSNNTSRLYKRSKIINHKKYLNVYIGNIGGSFAPSATPWELEDRDAVYLGFEWIGKGYRLLTHEVGHWFGLLHLHGSGGGKGDRYSCSDGDGISDTPPQKEATQTNGDCDDCPPPYGKATDKSCIPGQPSNYNNFMDYSGCRRMFTVEQVKKIRSNIVSYRPALLLVE
ncbi:M43 family zinc metalloprotease [Niabella sp. CJ426]|uniref:M43 family zinc metalloprotease n=1 Tax=Niabella sp. CJ426 TaxID=3393740 RepID=UPI003CFEDDFD